MWSCPAGGLVGLDVNDLTGGIRFGHVVNEGFLIVDAAFYITGSTILALEVESFPIGKELGKVFDLNGTGPQLSCSNRYSHMD